MPSFELGFCEVCFCDATILDFCQECHAGPRQQDEAREAEEERHKKESQNF